MTPKNGGLLKKIYIERNKTRKKFFYKYRHQLHYKHENTTQLLNNAKLITVKDKMDLLSETNL